MQPFTETVETVPVLSWSLSRSDEEVRNWFFTTPAMADAFTTAAKVAGPLEGFFMGDFQSNPHLVGLRAGAAEIQESDYRRHGLRIHEVRSQYLDWPYEAKEAAIQERLRVLRPLGVEWNQRLRGAMDHGALLESGTFTLKGDERLTIGTYLQLEQARYDVEGASHHFRQGTGPSDGLFLTTAQVTRGRGHLVRAQLGSG